MKRCSFQFRRRISIILALFIMISCLFIGTEYRSEAATGTWKKDSKGWYYRYSDGTWAKNTWIKSGKTWYHFNKYGYMQLGWQKISGKWYYFGTDGSMRVGWQKISGKWYFFGNGVMQTGWKKLSGKWYYFDSEGRMVTGKRTISGGEYIFNSNGVMIQDAKYYNIYKPFLNDVKKTVLRARDAGWSDSYQYIQELESRWGLCFYSNPTYNGFSYAFEDLNKDGTPELLLYLGINKSERELSAGFTIVNGKMKSFLIGWARNSYDISKDGYIYNFSSDGAEAHDYTRYKMGKTQLIAVDGVSECWGEYSKTVYVNGATTRNTTTISKAEFTRISEAWYNNARNTKNQIDVAVITLVKESE